MLTLHMDASNENVHKLINLQQEPSECDRIKKKNDFVLYLTINIILFNS